MSDLHLEFPFRSAEGHLVQGYEVFECIPSSPFIAFLGDIGLAAHGDLFDFLERQLSKYQKIFYVMGNHEYYGISIVSWMFLSLGLICTDLDINRVKQTPR